jgi:hypothetical protein
VREKGKRVNSKGGLITVEGDVVGRRGVGFKDGNRLGVLGVGKRGRAFGFVLGGSLGWTVGRGFGFTVGIKLSSCC